MFRYPWEWALADGIYTRLPNTHIPHRKPRSCCVCVPVPLIYFSDMCYLCYFTVCRGGDLTPAQIADNARLADARARIEHVNAFVVYSYELFHGRPFIRTFEDLHMYVTITVHTTAAVINADPICGEHFGRFNHPHYHP